jgi:hypothetical protein
MARDRADDLNHPKLGVASVLNALTIDNTVRKSATSLPSGVYVFYASVDCYVMQCVKAVRDAALPTAAQMRAQAVFAPAATEVEFSVDCPLDTDGTTELSDSGDGWLIFVDAVDGATGTARVLDERRPATAVLA